MGNAPSRLPAYRPQADRREVTSNSSLLSGRERGGITEGRLEAEDRESMKNSSLPASLYSHYKGTLDTFTACGALRVAVATTKSKCRSSPTLAD